MQNPWLHLPTTAPFVLEDDRAVIDRFNQTARAPVGIQTGVLPEPFLGRPDAPVVLLNLNPGSSPDDANQHENTYFVQMSRRNVQHAPIDFPFYLLDPQVGGPGYAWWQQKLKALLQHVDQQRLAHALLCVEYFPYHSKHFRHHRVRVPSQAYSFALVRAAMQRNAVIIRMRSERLWFAAIPELQEYSKLYRLKNVQNPTISPGNCPNGYADIVHAITEHTPTEEYVM